MKVRKRKSDAAGTKLKEIALAVATICWRRKMEVCSRCRMARMRSMKASSQQYTLTFITAAMTSEVTLKRSSVIAA
eukprot:1210061-Pyramimonas_sp.AAC.1